MKVLMFGLLLLLGLPAQAQVVIENPWARATPPGAGVAGGYMLIRNKGAAADRLIAASSPVAGKVELHVSAMENNVMTMREVAGYDVPANGSFELKPGGAHLMFMQLKQPFKQGDKVPVMLKFEKAGEMKAEFQIGATGSGSMSGMKGMKH